MAKSSKKSKDASAGTALPDAAMSKVPTEAAKPAPARAKASRKRPSAAARKTAPETKPRKATARKKATPSQVAVSDNDIRLRAYFLAEGRMRDGIGGDSAHDWIEARRQLLAEAAGRA